MTEYHVKRSEWTHFLADEAGSDIELSVSQYGKPIFRARGYANTNGLPILQLGRVIEVLPDGTAWVELPKEPPQELWASTIVTSLGGSVNASYSCGARFSTTNPPTLPSANAKLGNAVQQNLPVGRIVGKFEYLGVWSLDSVTVHARDGAGSILCSRCAAPYPYAEPPKSGPFVCYSCRVTL